MTFSNISPEVGIIVTVSETIKRREVVSLPSMTVDPSKCTKCGTCVKVCPAGIVKVGDTGLPEMDVRLAGRCIECGHCEDVCPQKIEIIQWMNEASEKYE